MRRRVKAGLILVLLGTATLAKADPPLPPQVLARLGAPPVATHGPDQSSAISLYGANTRGTFTGENWARDMDCRR